jgi:hypothetical protein
MSSDAIQVIPSHDEGMSTPEAGLRRQVMSYSPSMMLVRHRMTKGWVGTRHSHVHEQMVYIVSGHIRFEHPGGVFEAKSSTSSRPCAKTTRKCQARRHRVYNLACGRALPVRADDSFLAGPRG